MHKKNFKTWLPMAIFLVGIISIASEEPPEVPIVPNKSKIVAEVLNIERGDFPQTLITLQILESKNVNEFHNLLEPEEIIEASPQYVYEFTSGTQQIVFTDPNNIQNFLAYYLLPQDRISAIAKANGGNGNIVWRITDIKRIAEQEPERDIIAKVLNVEKNDFPEVDVTLKIIESGYVEDSSDFLEAGMIIVASPHYIYEEGKFVFTQQQNVKNLLAYYLLHGDLIKVKLTMNKGDDNIIWVISDLERLNQ
jgi:hypothetical protein